MDNITRRAFLEAAAGAAAAGAGPLAWRVDGARAQDAAPVAGVTSEQVAAAIQRGLAHLRASRSRRTGVWSGGGHTGGVTALNVLAMLNAGVPPDDPAVKAGLVNLGTIRNQDIYVVSLKCQVYAATGLKQYAPQLAEAARWLAQSQLANGMWTYGGVGSRRAGGRGDNSNTQFALLGLHEAAKAGAAVPREVWQKSGAHFKNTQLNDGGWTYVFSESMRRQRGRSSAYGSMTAAAVASVYICGQRLHVGGEKVFRNGVYPSCGKYRQDEVLAGGLRWLGDNFSVRENPRRGRGSWLYYYLYALERVGMISGMRHLGTHDWYREGAAFLVGEQRGDGRWGSGGADNAFALLFLAKGNRPVLVQKARWSGDWNRNIHDVENLTAFIDEKLGKRVTWQTVPLTAPVADLRQSPIIFLSGHKSPELTDRETDHLRAFVETGGTLLADACCGSKDFAAGFAKLMKKMFPEYRLRELKADHPVFSSYYRLGGPVGLQGADIGCRTAVFFLPRALSCLWELETIPVKSEEAFRIGTNVAAYATGKEQLPDKLDAVELPAAAGGAAQPAEIPRGAVRIARLIHDGDYRADIHAMVNLAAMLRDEAKVSVVARARHLRASDRKIYEYPVVFMTGHQSFKLSAAETAGLRKYLKHGGVMVADACCGRKAFDVSFRELAASLFPNEPLRALAADHPVRTGGVGVALGELRYRAILVEELKSRGTSRPPVEAVTLDGRTLILYSKYDFSCALEGDRPYSCRGYVDADGRKLAMNLFLYAISY